MLPPFPSLPDEVELLGDVERQVETKAGYEADTKVDDVPLPNPQDLVALAALEPLVNRAGRTSRPPAHHLQQVIMLAEYIHLLREIA